MKYSYDRKSGRFRDDKGRWASVYQVEGLIRKTPSGYRYRGKFIPKRVVEGGKKSRQTFSKTYVIDRQTSKPFDRQLKPNQQLIVRITFNYKGNVTFGYYSSGMGVKVDNNVRKEIERVMINHLFTSNRMTEKEKREIYEKWKKYVVAEKYYVRTWYSK